MKELIVDHHVGRNWRVWYQGKDAAEGAAFLARFGKLSGNGIEVAPFMVAGICVAASHEGWMVWS